MTKRVSYILISTVFLTLAVSTQAFSEEHQSARNAPIINLEEKYSQTRNHSIQKFKNNPINHKDREAVEARDEEDRRVLAELEHYLHRIIGPVKLDGLPGKGKINLETLQLDGRFGMLDGLRFEGKEWAAVVTTRSLLDEYLSTSEWPNDIDALASDGTFYGSVIDWDSFFASFGEFPTSKEEQSEIARAFLMFNGQDVGDVPSVIVLFFVKRDKVVVAWRYTKEKMKPLPECRNEWKKYQDTEQAFDSYRACFAAHLKDQPYFSALQTQAQSMVDRLQKIIP